MLSFIQESEEFPKKRDIVKGLGVKGEHARRELNDILRALKKDNLYKRPLKKPQRREVAPPPKEVLEMGESVIGSVFHTDLGLRFIPSARKMNIAFELEKGSSFDPQDVGKVYGSTVVSMNPPTVRVGNPFGEVEEVSLLVAHLANLPRDFPKEATKLAEKGSVPKLGDREDLRSVPLVTIDGNDSRDFDDAVWAEPDPDPKNKGGWHIIVAIADVAHYVRPGSALDQEAYSRGTSVYFPDRVIPMLPTVLSNGLCSLNPREDRACLAVHIWIDAKGQKKSHRFCRGLMRSAARMTYEEVQSIHETPDHPRQDRVHPLYGAFQSLRKGREIRGTLEIEVPEPYVIFNNKGLVEDLVPRERLDSHRLIEEFMVLANVAAAEALEKAKLPCMYRVHDAPNPEKLQELQHVLKRLKIAHEGPLETPQDLTRLLVSVKDTPHQTIVNELVLRSQSQALYQPKNLGHFGLNLSHYAHFTSPIRRYADILVHRALLRTLGYEEDALPSKDGYNFEEYGGHISTLERRAQSAERDAMDRYMTHYLSGREGEAFDVYVTGVTKAGLFVTIPNLNASGLVPLRLMDDDYYIYRENPTRLEGRRCKRKFGFGDFLKVRLLEADLTKGRLSFEPLLEEGKQISKGQKFKRKHKKRRRSRR